MAYRSGKVSCDICGKWVYERSADYGDDSVLCRSCSGYYSDEEVREMLMEKKLEKRANPGKKWFAMLYDPTGRNYDSLFGYDNRGRLAWISRPSRYTLPYAVLFSSREEARKMLVGRWYYPGRYLLVLSDGLREFVLESGTFGRIRRRSAGGGFRDNPSSRRKTP